MAIFILLIAMEAAIAQGQGNGNDKGKGNENGKGKGSDNGKGKGEGSDDGKGKKNKKDDGKDKKPKEKKPKKQRDEASDYDKMSALPSGQERGFCRTNTTCEFKTIVCPSECAERKPKKNKKKKACFIDCSSSTCEATCKGKFQGT